MDAARSAEEPDQIRSLNGEWFPTDLKLSLLCTAMIEIARKLQANLRRGRNAAFRLQARWNFATPQPLASPASSLSDLEK